jgi:hypothetical protein
MFLKIHHSLQLGDVVAVCDGELINTTLKHGKLEVNISESFYGTYRATPDEVRAALEKADNINLMGERAVDIAVGMGLITRSGCIMIGAVPHAQVYRI